LPDALDNQLLSTKNIKKTLNYDLPSLDTVYHVRKNRTSW